MATNSGSQVRVLIAVLLSLVALAGLSDGLIPATMTLERAFPVSGDANLTRVVARDRARHGRMLQSTSDVVGFSLYGSFDPLEVGLYYTKIQLGSPPKDFYVQIDSGSDVLWVSCDSCSGCPSESSLKVPLNSFSAKSSSTASEIKCSDDKCAEGMQSSEATCSAGSDICSYSFQYGDGSKTLGYYVSDTLYFNKVAGESQTTNSSASIVFGCSTSVSGQLAKTDGALSGIFGFGQQSLSVVSQLASKGVTPKAFSHCLRGDDAGGGILVLGEIVEPSMIYSPLVQSQAHYNLNLESISVNGQVLSIDSSVFATSTNGGTIIDSGTTLAYLAEKAYTPVINAIDAAASAQRVSSNDNICYLVTSSVDNVFPQVTLNFEGNASMVLGPQDYLVKQGTSGGGDVWCIGLMEIQGGLTILGDLILKDKIIVYDLVGQRIGWANYDCSMSVNVTTTVNTGKTETVSAGQPNDGSSSSRALPDKPVIGIVTTFVVYTLMISSYMFL